MVNIQRECKKIVFVAGVLCFTSLQADLLYVCNSQANTISVIDSTTNTVTSTITVSGTPMDLAFTPDQQFAYILSTIGTVNTVLVLDVATNDIVATITAGMGTGMLAEVSTLAITPNGQFVYAGNYGSGDISVIDTALNSVIATIDVNTPFGILAQGITISSDGSLAYVSGTGGSPYTFAAIDTSTNTIVANGSAFAPPATHFLNALSLDGNFLYVTGVGDYLVISTVTGDTIATVSVPSGTGGIAINSSGTELYITETSVTGNLLVVDAPAGTITTATIAVGLIPWFNTLSTNENLVYVSNESSNSVTVVDITANTAVATIPVGASPFGSALLIQTIPPTPSFSTPSGHQVINRFLTQTDVVNLISWSAPTDFIPVSYRIFRDAAFTDLAGTVPAPTLEFEDHNRQPKTAYTYFIVAVAADGSTLASPSVTVVP